MNLSGMCALLFLIFLEDICIALNSGELGCNWVEPAISGADLVWWQWGHLLQLKIGKTYWLIQNLKYFKLALTRSFACHLWCLYKKIMRSIWKKRKEKWEPITITECNNEFLVTLCHGGALFSSGVCWPLHKFIRLIYMHTAIC